MGAQYTTPHSTPRRSKHARTFIASSTIKLRGQAALRSKTLYSDMISRGPLSRRARGGGRCDIARCGVHIIIAMSTIIKNSAKMAALDLRGENDGKGVVGGNIKSGFLPWKEDLEMLSCFQDKKVGQPA